MEYLILNEESIPFQTENSCKEFLPVFFKILSDAFDNRIKAVRVSDAFDRGWYSLLVADNYFLRKWISEQDKEYSIRLKTLISKTDTPQIPIDDIKLTDETDLSEFYLKEDKSIKTPSLGAAYLLYQAALSFNSAPYWLNETINIVQEKLNENAEIDLIDCNVSNISDIDHLEWWLKQLQQQRKENSRKGEALWKNRVEEFPNLIFCKKTEKQIQKLSVNDAMFSCLWENLKLLDKSILSSDSDSDRALINNTGLTITDESDSVKQNPKLNKYRTFKKPDGNRVFFGLHIKNFPGYFRLYILPDYKEMKIYIGYFGKHLPL